MRNIILSTITGAFMALILFGAYEIAHGAKLEREFTKRRELVAGLPSAERRALYGFLRSKGWSGLPYDCTLYVVFDGDPEDSHSYRSWCPKEIKTGTPPPTP